MGGTQVVRYNASSLELTSPSTELNLYVGQLTPKQKKHGHVAHALNVQRALASGNYHKLFVLYMSAPNMGAYIMDHFIDRERIRALMVMAKASVQHLSTTCPSSHSLPDIGLSHSHSSMTSLHSTACNWLENF